MATADRGKVAEKKLQVAFKKLEAARADFTFERIQDARSSMGRSSTPRAGDFALYYSGLNLLVEVKEVAHDYRLPCANFGLDQRARAKKRMLAGTHYWVVIYHSTTDQWRTLTLEYFGLQTAGSWDLRGIPTKTLAQVMEALVCLPTPTPKA